MIDEFLKIAFDRLAILAAFHPVCGVDVVYIGKLAETSHDRSHGCELVGRKLLQQAPWWQI